MSGHGFYMFCVAYMICALGLVLKFAVALLLMCTKKRIETRWKDTCACNGVCSFDQGLYMLCVACMIRAYVFAATFAIALLVNAKSKNIAESAHV